MGDLQPRRGVQQQDRDDMGRHAARHQESDDLFEQSPDEYLAVAKKARRRIPPARGQEMAL